MPNAPLSRRFLNRLKDSRAARNMVASYFSFASTSVWALLSIPIAVKFLEPEEIGLWTVINVFVAYLGWMDFGISLAVGRLMAPAVVAGDQTELNRWWTIARVSLLCQAGLVLLIGAALIPSTIQLLGINAVLQADAKWLFGAGVVAAAAGMPLRSVPGLLAAQERFHWIPLVDGIVPWCNLVVFYLLLQQGWGVKAYAAAIGAALVTSWICYSVLVSIGPQRPCWDWSGLEKTRFRKLFSFSSGLMAIGMMEAVFNSLPSLLIARLGGVGMVPIFNFSTKGALLESGIICRTYQSFQPGWQRAFIAGDALGFRNRFESAGLITLGFSLAGAAAFLLFNPLLVGWLAGSQYYAGDEVNQWIAVGIITVPIGIYFQSLLTLSGALGKVPLVFAAKLLVAILAGVASWKHFGMAGIAMVFVLLPLVNAVLGYVWGGRGCGFGGKALSRNVALAALGSVTLLIVAGRVMASDWGVRSSTEPHTGVPLPSSFEFAISGIVMLAGVAIIAWGVLRRAGYRSLRKKSSTNPA